ncbi:MAG TPA: HAMP domain-containing sensor histidine kinase [Labilithrix sp.]|nr:HAMP domain-containing sensor histidine kinase [Labilithrix sp.]
MTASLVLVGVVCEEPVRAALVSAIEAAGAAWERCDEGTVIAKGGDVDALVFDVGAAPERYAPVAITLATDARTRWVPRLLIVDGATPTALIAPFGLSLVLPSTAPTEALARAMTDVVAQVQLRSDLARQAAARGAELRVARDDLTALQKEGHTLSHDARVLFGVIMGFAGNLRDGIAGPVVDLQRAHASSIVEAATDAATLLDRYITALRRTDRGPSVAGAASAAPARRRQNDVAELARSTVALFGGIASAKQIRLEAHAPRAVLAWCDGMQVKQVLVNLLANALKFTLPGGVVEVTVGSGPPLSTRSSGSARREIELVVSDSGPGVPEADRDRVFERGVRLGRDSLVPGTGLGLAVVRDIVELHGGSVRIESASLGGASFVLSLPADLRARAADRLRSSVSE